jgi:hypothetical protein
MAIREKEAWDELEKGEYLPAVRNQERWMPWRDAGLTVYYKVNISNCRDSGQSLICLS